MPNNVGVQTAVVPATQGDRLPSGPFPAIAGNGSANRPARRGRQGRAPPPQPPGPGRTPSPAFSAPPSPTTSASSPAKTPPFSRPTSPRHAPQLVPGRPQPAEGSLPPLGLSSAALCRLAGDLTAHLDRPVSPALFFCHPTVRQLATTAGQPDVSVLRHCPVRWHGGSR